MQEEKDTSQEMAAIRGHLEREGGDRRCSGVSSAGDRPRTARSTHLASSVFDFEAVDEV